MEIGRRRFLIRVFSLLVVFSAMVFSFCLSRILVLDIAKAETLPSYFDLRDVNGKNYVTPLKNQGDRDICWAFATIASFESSLMKQGLAPTSNPQIFSEYQLDFALSSNGMRDSLGRKYFSLDYGYFYNEPRGYMKGTRTLGKGGNPAFWFLSRGYSPMLLSDFGENKYRGAPIYEEEVFNTDNVDYYVPDYDKIVADGEQAKIDAIKRHLMEYGAVTVGTMVPSSTLINQTSMSQTNHTMVVIGWDDNYYSYRNQKKGAWILKNSWGEDMSYPYLSYDSTNYATFYGIKEIKEKTWDNNYTETEIVAEDRTVSNYIISGYNYGLRSLLGYEAVYLKAVSGEEEITEINFRNAGKYGDNAKYDIYVSLTGEDADYNYVKTVSEELPGSIKVDFSDVDDDLKRMSGDKFGVKILSEGLSAIADTPNLNVFTKNVGSWQSLPKISAMVGESTFSNIPITLATKNIENLNRISIKFYDDEDNDVTDSFTVRSMKQNGKLLSYSYSGDVQLSEGQYHIKVFYDIDELAETDFLVTYLAPVSDIGNGTEEAPFVITTPEQLMKIGENADYMGENMHYKLGTNIDFAEYLRDHSFNPIGGSFSGELDGDGHEIYNIERSNGASVALFYNTKNAYIHDLIIRDSSISSNDTAAVLTINDDGSTIENVYIKDVWIYSKSKAASIAVTAKNGKYKNIYSSVRLSGGIDCGFACMLGDDEADGMISTVLRNFVFAGDATSIYLISETVKSADIKNVDLSNNGRINPFRVVGNISSSAIIKNIFVFDENLEWDDHRDSLLASSTNMENFYATDGMNLLTKDAGFQRNVVDKIHDRKTYLGFDFAEDCDVDDKQCIDEGWKMHYGYPRLNSINYEYAPERSIGTSSKYSIDKDSHTISNVKIYKGTGIITRRQFIDNFEYFEGEIYESDGTTLVTDNDAAIRTNMLVKNGSTVYMISVSGDIDGDSPDGRVNVRDITFLRRYLAGGYGVEFSEAQKLAADLDQDGTVNIGDVVQLRRAIAGGYGNDYMIYDTEGN